MIVGVVLAVAVLVFHAYQVRQWAAERELLVKAVLARHPGELVALTHEPRPRRKSEPESDERVVQVGV